MAKIEKLGVYIEKLDRPNSALKYGIDDVRGITNTKQLSIGTKANLIGRSFEKFTILAPKEFIFNRRTSRNGERISLGYNSTDREWILTEDYCHFRVKKDKENELDPDFLYLFFLDDEFDRYARFNSWGSATEFFNWEEIIETPIPVLPMADQKKIVHDFQVLSNRMNALKTENDRINAFVQASYLKEFGQYDVYDKTIELPPKWRIIPAHQKYSISIGKTPPREETQCFSENPTDYIWVSIADMKNAAPFILSSQEYLTGEAIDTYNVKKVPENTILVSFKMTVGRVAITQKQVTTNEAIAHFPCNTDDLFFMFCQLSNYNYDKLGNTSSITTAVNSQIIKDMPILVPDDQTVSTFSKKMAPFFECMKNNAMEVELLEKLKRILIKSIVKDD